MEWAEFALAFVVFFVSHSVPVRPPIKPRLVKALGQRGFTIVYSALSLGVLVWLIVAAERAPFVPLWYWALWHTYIALALMLLACLVLALGIGRPNPFSFGGAQNHRFDAQRPGIIRLTRHPLLLGLGLWAVAHLIVNGDLAHVILFGVFSVFAAFGSRLVDRRKQREMGDAWDRLQIEAKQRPLASVLIPVSMSASLRITLGVTIFLVLIWIHPWIIGVDPLGGAVSLTLTIAG